MTELTRAFNELQKGALTLDHVPKLRCLFRDCSVLKEIA